METREISHLADLILKRKQTILTHTAIEKKECDNTSFDDRIKEIQDEKGIIDKKNQNVTILWSNCRKKTGNRSSGSYAEVMRISKLIDTKRWL